MFESVHEIIKMIDDRFGRGVGNAILALVLLAVAALSISTIFTSLVLPIASAARVAIGYLPRAEMPELESSWDYWARMIFSFVSLTILWMLVDGAAKFKREMHLTFSVIMTKMKAQEEQIVQLKRELRNQRLRPGEPPSPQRPQGTESEKQP